MQRIAKLSKVGEMREVGVMARKKMVMETVDEDTEEGFEENEHLNLLGKEDITGEDQLTLNAGQDF